ncbi:TPA: helix-turn-helix transcriptional regulator [Legionella pneumophila]|nr:helix-turn-helix transcriptional regulator [Legionella pneumophila]
MNAFIHSQELFHFDAVRLLTSIPQSILVKNESLHFVAANDKAAQLTGFNNPNEMIGLNDAQLNCAAAALHEEIGQQDYSVLKGDNQYFLDIGYYSGKGSLTILFTSKIKIFDEKNRSFILVSTTEIPMIALNSMLFSLINSIKNNKKGVQSYQIRNDIYPIKLTNKQSECLFYLLRGKSMKEIAFILNRSPRTIEDHVNLLKCKFNCVTKSQLIDKAFQFGFGQIIPPTLLAF